LVQALHRSNPFGSVGCACAGLVVNTGQRAKKKKVTEPTRQAESVTPAFKGSVQMATPPSSGTAYTALETWVPVTGENEAFEAPHVLSLTAPTSKAAPRFPEIRRIG
jgi:iron(III) transport system substrate-binding protein